MRKMGALIVKYNVTILTIFIKKNFRIRFEIVTIHESLKFLISKLTWRTAMQAMNFIRFCAIYEKHEIENCKNCYWKPLKKHHERHLGQIQYFAWNIQIYIFYKHHGSCQHQLSILIEDALGKINRERKNREHLAKG